MKDNIRNAGVFATTLLIAFTGITLVVKQTRSSSRGGQAFVTSTTKSRAADRALSDPDRERRRKGSIALAAQKWYEELLEKYPRMKPVYRDVPDDRNGYLQLLLLAESVKEPLLPEELVSMLQGDVAWDSGKFREWLSKNQDSFDRILRAAELPDQSARGITLDRLINGPSRVTTEFSRILLGSARLAFESGDQEGALRYMNASGRIGDHLVDIEVPSMLNEVISTGIRARARDSFYEHFLPALAGDPQTLRNWQDAVFRNENPASEYARVMTGEWNMTVRSLLLPAFLGDYSIVEKKLPVGDVAGLLDSYTRSIQKSADGILQLGSDRFDVSNATLEFPAHPNSEAGDGNFSAGSILFSIRGMTEALGSVVTANAMNSAAISILLGETPRWTRSVESRSCGIPNHAH